MGGRLKYFSVFSGIEAVSAAWVPLGMEPVAFSEIDPFASRVIQKHYPHVPNIGDVRNYAEVAEQFDVLVGGSPCQGFSVGGRRQGLEDPRSQLLLVYLEAVRHFRPRFLLWENVPGVLQSNGGRDFATFLWQLSRLGYHAAWRCLDASNMGVPQFRRRIFLVGCLGDWHSAAEVLFESESCGGNPPPIPSERKKASGGLVQGVTGCLDTDCGFSQQSTQSTVNGMLIPCWWDGSQVAYTLTSSVLAKQQAQPEQGRFSSVLCDLNGRLAVRKLTPVECERLMGLPDNWTAVDGENTPDTPRYRAIGNSIAVPCLTWIGKRLLNVGADNDLPTKANKSEVNNASITG